MRQEAKDREVDAKVHLKRAEDEVAQLGRDLFKSQAETLEAQENARKYEKDYHETLVLLKRARAENPAAANQVDPALIQLLEEQLNNTRKQLNQLRAEHAPSAAEAQTAVQQSQTNEQLEALCAECNKLHEAIQKAVTDRDRTCKANLQLWMQSLQDKANSTTENSALRARCMKAEAEVAKL